MYSDHPFDVDPGDSSAYCYTVRVTRPCHVATLVEALLSDPGTFAELVEDDWSAGTVPVRPEGVDPQEFMQQVRPRVRVILCFEHDFQTQAGGTFRNLDAAQLEETFGSYLDAMGIWIEDTADLDGPSWAALAAALPRYRQLWRFELHGARVEPPIHVISVMEGAVQCPQLRGLSLGVEWDGEMTDRRRFLPFPKVNSIAVAGVAVGLLAKAEEWLWEFPKLRHMKIGLSAEDDVAFVYEGLKAGFLGAIRDTGLLDMALCEVLVLFPPIRRNAAAEARCALLRPGFPCALQMRPEDYAFARRCTSGWPGYRFEQLEHMACARLEKGVFDALRHRQWTRHLVLDCFLHHAANLWPGSSECVPKVAVECAVDSLAESRESVARALVRMVLLPKGVWCRILEWWLGGRIFPGTPSFHPGHFECEGEGTSCPCVSITRGR